MEGRRGCEPPVIQRLPGAAPRRLRARFHGKDGHDGRSPSAGCFSEPPPEIQGTGQGRVRGRGRGRLAPADRPSDDRRRPQAGVAAVCGRPLGGASPPRVCFGRSLRCNLLAANACGSASFPKVRPLGGPGVPVGSPEASLPSRRPWREGCRVRISAPAQRFRAGLSGDAERARPTSSPIHRTAPGSRPPRKRSR
jgi:hypothetical protein